MRKPLIRDGFTDSQIAGRRLSQFVLLFLVAGSPVALAQDFAPSTVLQFARLPRHGFQSFSSADRLRIAKDAPTLAFFAGLLKGTERTAAAWDSAAVIWWLAESGDAQYVPIFLEGSRRPDTSAVFTVAAYGLVRSSGVPAASRRIEELMRRGTDRARANTVALLTVVNDTSARRLLRGALSLGLDAALAERADRALRRRENSRERARWPSLDP